MSVIEATGLVKHFGRVRALDGVDLRVDEGTVHGFLGPNGAGKSTTIRVLLGLLRANTGTATVFGLHAWRDAVSIHGRLAYVPGDVTLWPSLTGGEAIDTLTRLRGQSTPAPARERLIERFQLDPRRRCATYSKGNRQKVALVAALASPAEVLILDEPTSGLDPLMEAVFRDEVQQRVAEGTTVLLSSHILSEVELLCDRVSIIREGHIVEDGTLSDLRHLSHSVVSWVGATSDGQPIEDVVDRDGRFTGSVLPADLSRVLEWLGRSGATSVTMQQPSLEELFMRHYGEDIGRPGRRGRHARTD